MSRAAERRLRGFVSWLVANPITLSVAGGGLVAAVLAGISLGNAAVEGIDPVHFSAAPPPRLRQPENPPAAYAELSRPPPAYADLYGWDEGAAAMNAACGPGCGEDDAYAASIPYFGSREELATAQREAREKIDSDYADEVAEAARRARQIAVELPDETKNDLAAGTEPAE